MHRARTVSKALIGLTATLLLAGASMAQAPNGPPPGGPPPGGPGGPGGAPGGGQEEANPPLIDKVSYSGNTKIATAALAKDAKIAPGMKVSRALVGGEIDRIVKLYKAAGFDLAVSPDIQHPADGHVTVTFKIDENGKGGNGGPAPGAPPAR